MSEKKFVVVDSLTQVSSIDAGKGIALEALLQVSGEQLRIVFPYTLVSIAVQALIAGEQLARLDRGEPGDHYSALDAIGGTVGGSDRASHISLGFALRAGGILGVLLDRNEANRLAALLQKWSASPEGPPSGSAGPRH